MMDSWIEIVGFAGSFLTVITYLTHRMVQLRVMAKASSLCFAVYGTMIGSPPLIFMEAALLPNPILNPFLMKMIEGAPRKQHQETQREAAEVTEAKQVGCREISQRVVMQIRRPPTYARRRRSHLSEPRHRLTPCHAIMIANQWPRDEAMKWRHRAEPRRA
ncbi:YgjV family protein [Neorhizobium vignae]|uniref:YgjV family protein n=1 Tax=Neorhizobium vignae TaxID=690585 RepID=UPI00056A4927|nr:YgjV family protein [Neorhizobium vignae]